jgi:hypothetical protein
VPHQTLVARGGRAFASFEQAGAFYLLAAGLLDPPGLMRWDGERFETIQELDGAGARELAVLRQGDALLVVRINFILGTPADPQPVLDSEIYAFSDGALHVVARFPTCGGTDAAVIEGSGEIEIAVSNSLSPELRFAADTVLYTLEGHAR